MTTSSALRQAWTALALEQVQLSGLYERRLFANSGFAVFAGLLRPGMQLRLSVGVPSSVDTTGLERETKAFRVLRQSSGSDGSTRVSLELLSGAFRELFEVMADDVAARVLVASDESSAVAMMRERLNHWERFMSAAGPEGLSREKQIGLYGELMFLRTMLSAGIPGTSVITWWRGPFSQNQDFRVGSHALEVKTTTGNTATAIRIANELQLDGTDFQPLYLLHLSLNEMLGAGTNLPQLVDEVQSLVGGGAAQDFADRLFVAGYHEIHRPLYEEIGYVERQRHYYAVDGTFPRILQSELRSGVSRVEYTIDVGGFASYARPESLVLDSLTGPGT